MNNDQRRLTSTVNFWFFILRLIEGVRNVIKKITIRPILLLTTSCDRQTGLIYPSSSSCPSCSIAFREHTVEQFRISKTSPRRHYDINNAINIVHRNVHLCICHRRRRSLKPIHIYIYTHRTRHIVRTQ